MNSEQQQQRIMGYFIEEAREHLQTIEQGVLNLQDVLRDSESTNELFRAAHSIKGGAAMLGVGSIQHVSHRLEDFFKILKENPQITVDERLKSLLLAGFDPLSELLDELEGSFRISNELTTETSNRVKPIFAEVESYLNQLVLDTDGEILIDAFSQEEESITQPQELVVSQESVFQQEITTKMRDMLQLFRVTDNVESRSQLQAVCNYFQEIGNDFDLRNWANLVTQIKNAIAQPSNSYRTLAPILIRELKEAQDLVLADREAEIVVSLQLQNLLPYRFSDSEEDEVSTIFTTAFGDIDEGSIVEDFEISDTASDENIDLFADQVDEEEFDLTAIHENQIDQMDWMESEYEIVESQHIDGPKVGASELKSLAILFENDDIDFDATWEDIESNETSILNHGDTDLDSHDEFADLLGNDSDNNDLTVLSLGNEESSIDKLFGDFSTEDSATREISDSLFPDDLDDAWQKEADDISEISLEITSESSEASLDLDRLFTDDFTVDNSLDDQFDVDLDMDIVEQSSDFQIDNELPINDQFNDINFNEVLEINIDNPDFPELLQNVATAEQLITEEAADTQDESQNLSSEEYFAQVARQESAIADVVDDDSPSDPFALTFSEEGMTLLEDPFAINGNFDEVLSDVSPEIVNEEIINADVDTFLEDSEEFISGRYTEGMSDAKDFDTIETFGLNIFDELGFDTDELDESVSDITGAIASDNFVDKVNNTDDLGDFFVAGDSENLALIANNDEPDIFTDQLDNFFATSEVLEISSDITDSSGSSDESSSYEVGNIDDLGDFFSGSEEAEIVSSDIENELATYANVANNTDTLGSFFDGSEEPQHSDENIDDDAWDEFTTDSANSLANNEDLTVLENLWEDDFNFDREGLLTQSDDIDNFASMPDFQNTNSSIMESGLTAIEKDLNLEDDEITVKTTIANLADFFQGEDESDVSLLQLPEDVGNDHLAVDEPLDFGEFNEFTDLNGGDSPTSDFFFTQDSEINILEPEHQSQIEELNGIDDNFDFDDLEAMISSSSHTSNDINDFSSNTFTSQITDTLINDQVSIDSDDMNFDELEALLGESSSFEPETNKATSPNNFAASTTVKLATKPTDDFDELESMLQSAFAKDVGPIKTKSSSARPSTTTRKAKLADSTMRVDVKYLDSLNNLVGELVVNRNLLSQDQEKLQQFITNLLQQVQLLSDVSQRMRDQYDRSLLEASLTAGRGRSFSSFDVSYSGDGGSSNTSASSDFEGIEFDRYNTFHVLSQEIIELIVRVRESASDIEFVVGETDQVTRQLGTITTQVQDDLKQSRMVPFALIADKLPRGIRDRALKSGKQADLEVFGRETLIDKAILEQLNDPLTHLVNNAIDHGLEDPATRQAAGKSAMGKLAVRAYHQGNQTVISISDDGAGISTDKVKKIAVSKRVRSQAEVDQLNDTEVYALLFEPGFSTAAQADEFKGRGVGLDVVKTCLDDIRGVIIVESLVGKGTTFTIRLPLTLSISKAMFCISDRARIAFPVDGFEDMVEVPQSQIVLNEKGQPCLPWRDTILPFQHLSNLLSYSRHLSRSSIYGKQENDELCIIILRNDTSYLALQVDQFQGEYEIVIKQLEGPVPQPAGIAGATVLGDGRVMAIANVLELFDIASGRLRPSISGIPIKPAIEEEVAADPTVLIVDDSITVRELLSLTFAKVGYRVEQAKDGQDAWEKLRAGLPCDMIFCDIEMPRMDGLDLLSRLQKDERLKGIPVAMLTSRGADRHRQSAIQLGAKGYFTKPYLEEELLSASKRLLAGETLPI
ncbi:MAG: response regulator [Pseudanabaena sp. CAN_BIN31]|nr:response regulator [Pseudanabaena sp. CAN_BIN31]